MLLCVGLCLRSVGSSVGMVQHLTVMISGLLLAAFGGNRCQFVANASRASIVVDKVVIALAR